MKRVEFSEKRMRDALTTYPTLLTSFPHAILTSCIRETELTEKSIDLVAFPQTFPLELAVTAGEDDTKGCVFIIAMIRRISLIIGVARMMVNKMRTMKRFIVQEGRLVQMPYKTMQMMASKAAMIMKAEFKREFDPVEVDDLRDGIIQFAGLNKWKINSISYSMFAVDRDIEGVEAIKYESVLSHSSTKKPGKSIDSTLRSISFTARSARSGASVSSGVITISGLTPALSLISLWNLTAGLVPGLDPIPYCNGGMMSLAILDGPAPMRKVQVPEIQRTMNQMANGKMFSSAELSNKQIESTTRLIDYFDSLDA